MKKKVIKQPKIEIEHPETLTSIELAKKLKTNLQTGLHNQTAVKRLTETGKNELPKGKVRP
jgi:magnesium-transporting ATPase (P-type)